MPVMGAETATSVRPGRLTTVAGTVTVRSKGRSATVASLRPMFFSACRLSSRRPASSAAPCWCAAPFGFLVIVFRESGVGGLGLGVVGGVGIAVVVPGVVGEGFCRSVVVVETVRVIVVCRRSAGPHRADPAFRVGQPRVAGEEARRRRSQKLPGESRRPRTCGHSRACGTQRRRLLEIGSWLGCGEDRYGAAFWPCSSHISSSGVSRDGTARDRAHRSAQCETLGLARKRSR